MTYQINSTILATDFNTLIGSQGTNAYTSGQASAAAPAAGLIYGVGYGDRGYGQTQYAQNALVSGNTITSNQWSNLRNMMADMSQHQSGSILSSIPPLSELAVGQTIEAHESGAPTSDPYDFNSAIATLDTNRFNVNTLSLAPVFFTETSLIPFSDFLTCQISVVFADGNGIRHFFNAGGQIVITLSQPGVSAQDVEWNNGFTNVIGEIRMGPTSTSTTGVGGFSSTIGYWDLNSSYDLIIDAQNFLTAPYDANDFTMEARYFGVNLNGSLGEQIDFRFTLIDDYAGGGDLVSDGTVVSLAYRSNTNFLINPQHIPIGGSVIQSWDGA